MYLTLMFIQLLLFGFGWFQIAYDSIWFGVFNVSLNAIGLVINYKNLNTEMDNYKKEKEADLNSLFDRFDKLKQNK